MARTVVDIGELTKYPVRSGIQRLVSELLRVWHDDPTIAWVRYDPEGNQLRSVPNRVIDLLRSMLFQTTNGKDEFSLRLAFELRMDAGQPFYLTNRQVVFVPEVFYSGDRIKFYRTMRDTLAIRDVFIVFDFFPWLNPSAYAITRGFNVGTMPYLDLIAGASARLFISQHTAHTYATRIVRAPLSPFDRVVPLGADGLEAPRQRFSPDRKIVCCVGAFDGKKGQELVYEAFRRLPPGIGLELDFAGKVPDSPDPKYRDLLKSSDTRVTVHGDVSDGELASLVSRARATIFVSGNEGFGLPALESLFIGVPLIAAASLPALHGLPAMGQIRLNIVEPASIASALVAIADDAVVEKLWEGASTLQLPTWRGFAAACRARLADLEGLVLGTPIPALEEGESKHEEGRPS